MNKLTIYIAKHRHSTMMSSASLPCSNCTKKIKELGIKRGKKYKVEGFPTFKIAMGNEIIEYDAKPDLESLERFILSTLSR